MSTSAEIRALATKWIGPAEDGAGVMNIAPEAMGMMTEDCVWQMPPSNPMGRVEGREKIGEIHAKAKSVYQWDTIRIKTFRVLVDGDQAVVHFELSCRQVIDDEPYTCQYAHFLTFRNGLICEIVDLFDSLSWYRQSGHKLERR